MLCGENTYATLIGLVIDIIRGDNKMIFSLKIEIPFWLAAANDDDHDDGLDGNDDNHDDSDDDGDDDGYDVDSNYDNYDDKK